MKGIHIHVHVLYWFDPVRFVNVLYSLNNRHRLQRHTAVINTLESLSVRSVARRANSAHQNSAAQGSCVISCEMENISQVRKQLSSQKTFVRSKLSTLRNKNSLIIKKGQQIRIYLHLHETCAKTCLIHICMCALYIMPMLIPAINILQVQTNRAYVKEIQVNQVSCASDLWSIKYLNSQDKSGKYSVRTVACYLLLISNCSGKINKNNSQVTRQVTCLPFALLLTCNIHYM